MKPNRRRFLMGSASLAASAVGGCSLASVLGDDDFMSRLTGFPPGDPAYRWIATGYLRDHPGEASRDVLIERLGFDPATVERLTAGEVAGQLFRAIQEDVARDELVLVRRWMLTRTEARLFALGSLAP